MLFQSCQANCQTAVITYVNHKCSKQSMETLWGGIFLDLNVLQFYMSQCSGKCEVKIKQRSCVSDIFRLSPSPRIDWLFSSFRRKITHVYSRTLMLLVVRVCRLSFHHASLWLPLSDTKLGPDSRRHSFKLHLVSPMFTCLLGSRRWERRKVCSVALWVGTRCTSLSTLLHSSGQGPALPVVS